MVSVVLCHDHKTFWCFSSWHCISCHNLDCCSELVFTIITVSLHYPTGSIQVLPVVVKSKPLDTETCNMVNKMAQGCGLNLAILYEQNKNNTGFKYIIFVQLKIIHHANYLFLRRHCSVREVEICRLANPIIQRFMPNTYSTLYEPLKVHILHVYFDHF